MKNTYTKGNTDWYLDEFKSFENRLNGQKHQRVHDLRQEAIKSFEKLGYPTTKHEEWKYTNVSKLSDQNFQLGKPYKEGLVTQSEFDRFIYNDIEAIRVVFINGFFAAELSNIEQHSDQIRVTSLKEALSEKSDAANPLAGFFTSTQDDTFVSLNTAFVEDGAFIRIPDGVDLKQPIHLLYLSLPDKNPTVSFPRNLIAVGRSSRVDLLETYAGLNDKEYFTNSVSEILVGQNAHVERIKIQLENEKSYHISSLNVFQERDSRFIDQNISLGGMLVRNNLSSVFKDEGAFCELNGLYTANGSQHIDNHTVIDHAKPHCESFELYKGILDDKAKGVFNGKIFVRPEAQKTNAIQTNNCILLSDTATIDTKPQLEIFADDVKCTHGATIGQLDEDAFFYMRTRGIEQSRARNLLIFAFASEVLDKIKIDSVREILSKLIAQKLHTLRPE